MLRIMLTSATILITITAAQAQGGAPPAPTMPIIPGMGGNAGIYGNSFANDYNRHGEDYARQRAYDRPSTYQPYPTVMPSMNDSNRSRYRSIYGDDD